VAGVRELATAHYLLQQRAVRRAATRAQEGWRRMSTADLDGSWQVVAPLLVEAVTAGQQENASTADAYVGAVVAADGTRSQPSGAVNTAAFVGQAADGRPLSLGDLRWEAIEAFGEEPPAARRAAG